MTQELSDRAWIVMERIRTMTEINLQRTMDARDWAKEFARLNGGDEEIMIGWFANAIMVGYDFGRKGKEKHLAHLDILDIMEQL